MNKKNIFAKVVKKSADKTISVAVVRHMPHSKYIKSFSITKKYLAHDESNIAKVGDMVCITSSRPVSKRKNHVLVEVIKDDNK